MEFQHERRELQTELEMQNEELRRAQIAIEESLDRYVDLISNEILCINRFSCRNNQDSQNEAQRTGFHVK